MEKPTSYGRNGGSMVKLPIGFRFHPTDEELVVHYLKRKAFSCPLPASVIPEFDVFQTSPWDFPGDAKERRFFFGKGFWGKRIRRVSGCGFWKAIGRDVQIVASGSDNRAVGMRRTLVFYQDKVGAGTRTRTRTPTPTPTQWVMHEYRLVGSATPPNPTPNSTQKSMEEMGDWVVYRVFQKRRRPKKHGGSQSEQQQPSQSIIDLVVEEEDSSDPGPPQPDSPSSPPPPGMGLDQEQGGACFSSPYSCFSF